MNLQPHQRQFAHQYTGPTYPQQQHPQNFQAQPAPEPCYNCGSPQHVAQHCCEARRAVPAGSLNQAPRPQRGVSQKRSNKPIVTRFAPPPNYANGNYPQQPPFPQTGSYQPSTQTAPYQPPHQQQQQQQWQQQAPQSYTSAQSWQQPYGAPPVTPQTPTYSPHQPAPNYGYPQSAQPLYPQQQQTYGGYAPQASYSVQGQPPQPTHSQYNPAQHSQTPYTQHQNYQQYPQQQPIQSPYTPITPSFPQTPHHGHGPQPQPQPPQAPAVNGTTPSQQQPPPPKPPPCFPGIEKNTNTSAKSGIIIWRPAQPTETPLEATFTETEEQRTGKNGKESRFKKYFDAKGGRINRDFYREDNEMMKDPIWTSIRAGGSMLAQPLDWELPDEPEEEVKMENETEGVDEGVDRVKVEVKVEVEVEGAVMNGSSDSARGLKSEKGSGKAQEAGGAPSETKKPWVRQPITSITSHGGRYEGTNSFSNNGTRGRASGMNQGGKRKSRSPLDNGRPQKHRVREPTRTLPQPSHHPLPPKPVAIPPPAQHFNQNRPQNMVVNRRGGHKSQRAHPYARRSASPVRHFLVDTQSQRKGGYGGGGNRRQQGSECRLKEGTS